MGTTPVFVDPPPLQVCARRTRPSSDARPRGRAAAPSPTPLSTVSRFPSRCRDRGCASKHAPTPLNLRPPLTAHFRSPSIAVWDSCNECGGQGIYASFVMATVIDEDPSRPPWPSCPSAGWSGGVDRLTSLPNGLPLVPRTSVSNEMQRLSDNSKRSTHKGATLSRAGAPTPNCTFFYNLDIDHGSLGPNPPAATPKDCCALCTANATCWSATWYQGLCWMKGPSNNPSVFAGAVSCWPAGERR